MKPLQQTQKFEPQVGSRPSDIDFVHDTRLPEMEGSSDFKAFSIDVSKSTPLGAFNRSLLRGLCRM